MIWQIFVLGWTACGVAAAGFGNAYYRSEYLNQTSLHRKKDLNFCLWWGILGGPFSLLIQLVLGNWLHGWSLCYGPVKLVVKQDGE